MPTWSMAVNRCAGTARLMRAIVVRSHTRRDRL
jgi:hypothetical protein